MCSDIYIAEVVVNIKLSSIMNDIINSPADKYIVHCLLATLKCMMLRGWTKQVASDDGELMSLAEITLHCFFCCCTLLVCVMGATGRRDKQARDRKKARKFSIGR